MDSNYGLLPKQIFNPICRLAKMTQFLTLGLQLTFLIPVFIIHYATGFYIPLEYMKVSNESKHHKEGSDSPSVYNFTRSEQSGIPIKIWDPPMNEERLTNSLNYQNGEIVYSAKDTRARRSSGGLQPDNGTPDLLLLLRRADAPELRTMDFRTTDQCKEVEGLPRKPLMCYQCKSDFRDPDPTCDHTLWRFTRRSEKYKLRLELTVKYQRKKNCFLNDGFMFSRIRCPVGQGDYCVKTVRNKRGEQLTERGCFGPEPVNGVVLQVGCVTYRQDGYLTTTCFCDEELCNAGSSYEGTLLITFVVVITSLIIN